MNMKLQKYTYPNLFPSEVFDDFFGNFGLFNNNNSFNLEKSFPKGEIYLDNRNTVIELMLAGYSKDQLSVYVEDNILIVSASKCEDTENDEGRSFRRKRSSFTRKFPILKNESNLDEIDVSYKDGLLRIVVPPLEIKKERIELTIK